MVYLDKYTIQRTPRRFKEEKNITENMENSVGRTEQLHLRVTRETYDVIKRKVAEFSMSISDYIVFVITHFNLMEFSEKVDEINRKLDALSNVHEQ